MKKFVIYSFTATFCLMIFYLSLQKSALVKDFEFKNPLIGEFEVVNSDNYRPQDLAVLTTVPKGTKYQVVHACPVHAKDSESPCKVFIKIDIPEFKNRVVDASALFKNCQSLTTDKTLG